MIRALAETISRRAALIGAALAGVVALAAAAFLLAPGGGSSAAEPSSGATRTTTEGEIVLGGEGADAGPTAAERAAAARQSEKERRGGNAVDFAGVSEDGVWVDREAAEKPPPKPVTDDEIRAELKAFRRYLASYGGLEGERARVLKDGRAVAPRDAPAVVKQVIQAANAIADTPYKWGGGHAGWEDTGYDCSGSVSFALAGAGLLGSPLDSSGFMRWGEEGPGRWITIYTNPGHMFMVVAGLRFDTSGARVAGTRWQPGPRSTAGFEARHFPGF